MRARIATVQLAAKAFQASKTARQSNRLTGEIDADTLFAMSVQARNLFMGDIIYVILDKDELKLLSEYIS